MSGSYLRRKDIEAGDRPVGRGYYPAQVSYRDSYGGYPYYEPPANRSGHEQVEQVLDLLFRRKWSIIVTLIIVLGGTAVYTFTREPRYEAYSYVSVDLGSPRMAVDLTGTGGTGDNFFATNDRTLLGEIALLQIWDPLRQRVMERYRLSQVPNEAGLVDTLVGHAVMDGYALFEPAPGAENIMRIAGSSAEPYQATLIANLYAEEYVQLTEEASREYFTDLRQSLEDRQKTLLAELREAEAAITNYMRREGATGLDANGQSLVESIHSTETERNQLAIDLDVAEASLEALQRQIDDINPNLSERITTERSAQNMDTRIQTLQTQLADEENKLSQIIRRNPQMATGDWDVLRPYRQRIRMLEAERDSLTDIYVGMMTDLGTVSGGQDGVTQLATLQQQATQQRIAIGGLEARIEALDDRLNRYQNELLALPTQTMELAQLERDRMHAESMYQFNVERHQDARIAEESEPGYAELVRRAGVPIAPVYPMHVRDLILGAFLGLLAGFAIAIVREKLDNRIYKPQQVRDQGFREIAVIPNLQPLIKKDHEGRKFLEMEGQRLATSLVSLVNPISAASEAYRQVRTFAQYNIPDLDLRTLLISSPGMMEGKSTTAANLAIVMAQAGRKTLLVDADMRRPQQHSLFGLNRDSGLRELLTERSEPNEHKWKTFIDNLYVLTADGSAGMEHAENGKPEAALRNGRLYMNPSELLGSRNMDRFLQEAQERFEIVVIDSPPVLAATDAILLSTKCDATIVVARTAATREGELDYTMEAFADVGARMLGVILNAFDISNAFGYKYRYRHYTKYGHYSKYGYSEA